MTLCAPNETLYNDNLGQKGLSDNTEIDFGDTKDHGSNGSLRLPPGFRSYLRINSLDPVKKVKVSGDI